MFPQRRMTTDTPDGNYEQALNLFVRGEDGWVQMPSRSISLNDYMKQLIKAHNADIDTEGTPEEFDMTLCEHLFDGPETIEGLLAEHYTLSWALASLRDKLKHYEDALIPEIMPEGLQTIDRAIGTYGKDAQLTKAVEEMSELTKALCKLKECKRKYDTPFNRETQEVHSNIEEEIADVFIMLVQLFAIFNPHELVNITKVVWDKLDQLNDEFETNRQTVKEFVAECDGLVESHNKVMDAYNSSTSSIKDQELGTLALTQRLGELASQNTQTTASYTEMKAIIDQLNADVPGLGLTYDGVTESVDATVEALEKAAKAQADEERKAEQMQTYVDLYKEQADLTQQIAEAEANLDSERQRRGMRKDDVTGDWVNGMGFWTEDSPWIAWTSDIDEYKKSLEELQAAYDENQQTLADIKSEWTGVAQAVEDAQNQTVTYDEAVSMATSSAQSALDELTAAYDKAYESARTSIEGQIGLFDTMKTSSELSISDMEKAMQSQTDYLNLYSENLKKAAEYGLDDGLIKSLSDGSEESAGYINAIIQNIEKLGGSTEGMPAAASKFVDEFNSKFEETEKAKDAFADNIAKMETDFDKTMSDIEQTMTGTVEKMEMADEAKEAAQATIKAYCDAIRSMTGEAGSAAEAVANAAASHLKTTPTTTPTATTVTGHANGTLSAREDVYIAGEEGPELIIGARGSEVFPTQETERILAAVNSAENATNAPEPTASPLPENDLPEGMEAVKEYSYLTADGQGSDAQPTGIEYVEPEVQAQTTEEAAPAEEAPVNTTAPAASDAQQEAPASSSDAPSIGETVKRIILEINGSGSIDVGGMNEESVLDILTRHAKPVLMSIIKGEIFEEGDLAYDF